MIDEVQPLSTLTDGAASAWIKQRVVNVIKSYHNAADVIAEPIQNAVDEVLSAEALDAQIGTVHVVFDTDQDRLSVRDNGRGISKESAIRFIAPDVGSKRAAFLQGLVRGHKGVGLTFLAYGFNFFELESRTNDEHYSLRLEGGRSWVESNDLELDPPKARIDDAPTSPRLTSTGTIVTIGLSPQTEPRSLRGAFPTAEYAVSSLRNQTAAGLVEPPAVNRNRELQVSVEYIANTRVSTLDVVPLYRFPHMDTPNEIRTLNIGEWQKQNRGPEPLAKDRKAYHACYKLLAPDEIIDLIGDRKGEKLQTRQEVADFVHEHEVHAYSMFAYSASYRDQLKEAWGIPGNRKVIHSPSLRIATDGMISSWSREVTLTHRGFNVDRTWITYSFRRIEPDLGRKDFPPEVHDLLSITEEVIANNIATLSRPFLRISPPRTGPTPSGYVAPEVKAYLRRQKPLVPASVPGFGSIYLRSTPESEQDVIALFSELLGMGILRHLRPVFYSGFDYYDSFFEYDRDSVPSEVKESLPGAHEIDARENEGVAEFKLQGELIIEDTVAQVKRWSDMTFLVCWEVVAPRRAYGGDEITFDAPADAASRRYHGITHLARLQSGGEHTVFVLSLKDLLSTLTQG